MIGVILVSHGSLAEGLKSAAEMIVGQQEGLLAIGMQPGADVQSLRRELEATIAQVRKQGEVLVLVDILGGTPANASFHLASNGTQVICGINLPMLLEILTQREYATLQELTALALQAAREGVIHLTQQLADQ